MAGGDFQEKTEQATPKKRRESREEGQVAKSIELSSVVVLLAGVFSLYAFKGMIYDAFLDIMNYSFTIEFIPTADGKYWFNFAKLLGGKSLLIMLPIFLAVFIAALIINFSQVGFVIASKAIQPKFNKLSPIKGFSRLFSLKSLAELIKSILKLGIIGIISYIVIKGESEALVMTFHTSVGNILLYMLKVVFKIFIYVILVMLVVAILDYIFQKWQFEKELKMSKQEIKDESKQVEGDPQVKSRIRSLQQQAARKRMMKDVPEADVVVTNPTHLAVAIKYDAMSMNAPQVVAKGAGLVAERIKSLAMQNNVPVIENKKLAQNLYKLVDIGQEVPAQFFQTVAELLAYVYGLKGKTAGNRR